MAGRRPKAVFVITAKDTSKRILANFKNSLKSVTSAVFSLKTAVGLAAGAAGLTLLITKTATAIDRIGKLSKTTGIATEDMAAFALAADIAGKDMEVFFKAARKLSENTFDLVARGSSEAEDAFSALGITTEELTPIMNDQVALMQLVGDRMSDLEDGSAKLALATDLFGGRAAELIPMLDGMSENLARARKETKLFGTALNEAQVGSVESMNDELTRTSQLFIGFTRQLTVALSPAISLAATSFREWVLEISEAHGGIEGFARTMATDFLLVLNKGIVGVARLVNWVGELKRSFETSEREKALIRLIRETRTSLNELLDSTGGKGNAATLTMTNQLKTMRKSLEEIRSDNKEPLIDIHSLTESLERARAKVGELATGVKKVGHEGKTAGTTVNRVLKNMRDNAKEVQKQFEEIGRIRAAVAREAARQEEESERVRQQAYEKSVESIERVGDEMIRSSQRGKQGFKDMAENILWELDAVLKKLLIINPLINAITGSKKPTGLESITSGDIGGLIGSAAKHLFNQRPHINSQLKIEPAMLAGDFAGGGGFTVPGNSGVDSKSVLMGVTPGERVSVERPGQVNSSQPVIQVFINNNVSAVDSQGVASFIVKAAPQIVTVVQEAFNRNFRGGPLG